MAPFDVLVPSGPRIAIVAHIPHASTVIPDPVRAEILLDDSGLAAELIRLTDWHTDRLFSWLLDNGGAMFVNRLSRLVFDPERFIGDAIEPMESVGQGVVYTRTTAGDPLRVLSAEDRSRRIETLYEPYHAALAALVAAVVGEFGHCLIVDCHSFPTVPLPSETDQSEPRPDICIGRDPFHTPPALAEALRAGLMGGGLRCAVRRAVLGDSRSAGLLPVRSCRLIGHVGGPSGPLLRRVERRAAAHGR